MDIPELLAPAGSPAALNAAVRAGADAVYLGLDRFNARQNADNFTLDALEEACRYAHLRGVKVYVTMNTLVLQSEMQDACTLAQRAYERGADAFIVQDLGLAANIMRMLPRDALHISTQMNIHSVDGLLAAAALGASRVTLARELSLGEIANLAAVGREAGVECEVFAHGALCVCYSGQCLMSSLIGGRSANRGMCAQACRLPYSLVKRDAPERELRAPGEFLLSPKDLCTAERLEDLAVAGVASLKVEGRMKSPEYVHAVVSVYRRALDRLREDGASASLPSEDREALGSVFSRGFTDAYLEGQSADELMSYQRPNNRGQFAGRVKSVSGDEVCLAAEIDLVPGDLLEAWTRKGNVRFQVPEAIQRSKKSVRFAVDDPKVRIHANDRVFRIRSAEAAFQEDAHEPRVPVTGEAWLRLGEPLRMEFRVAEEFPRPLLSAVGRAEGPMVEAARTKAVSADEVEEHVARMGSTPFRLDALEVHLDEGVGIGFSQVHKCRAAALEQLEDELLKREPDPLWETFTDGADGCSYGDEGVRRAQESVAPLLAVIATSPETARAAKRTGADVLYVPAYNYQRGGAEVSGCHVDEASQAGYPKGCVIMLPSVNRDDAGASAESRRALDAWKNVPDGSEVLVGSLGALHHAQQLGCTADVEARLPLVNPEACKVAEAFGARWIWLSPELNLGQIKALAASTPLQLGVKVYGAQELMVTEHCLLSSQGPCDEQCATCKRRTVPFGLKDRKDYVFPVVTDDAGRSHLYNSVTLDVVPEVPQLMAAGVSLFLVDATLMDVEQTAQAVGRVRQAMQAALDGGEAAPKMPNTTSGHLHRGI